MLGVVEENAHTAVRECTQTHKHTRRAPTAGAAAAGGERKVGAAHGAGRGARARQAAGDLAARSLGRRVCVILSCGGGVGVGLSGPLWRQLPKVTCVHKLVLLQAAIG